MKIIIVGAGKVGYSIAALLAEEGHDITIIDRDGDTIQALSNDLDVICVEGSATNPETLREAGAASADLLLAATEQDEVNMICGITARKLGTAHVIARVRDPEYLHQTEFLREALGLSVLVNPEYECAKEISRTLRFPGAVRVDAFSKGSLEIAELKIPAGGKLEGLALKELTKRFGAKVLVSVVERDGDALIPNGNFELRAGDRLSVTGDARELRRFFTAIGEYKRPVRRVMIMGGGRSSVYLTRMLQENGISARKLGTAHVIARVRDPEYLHQTEFLREALGLSVLVNPEYECAKEISRTLRFPGAVRVDAFSKGSLEIAELKIPEGGRLAGLALKELPKRFGAKVLVSVVERGGDALIPNGNFELRAGDRLSVTGDSRELRRFFTAIGEYKRPVRRVMLMGGGRSSVYLTRMLQENGISVTVVERDRERCDQLCDLIPEAHVVCGDATNSDVLQEDGLSSADAFVALTGDDEDNIITSLYAKNRGISKVVVKVNRDYLSEIIENVGLNSVVSPKEIVSQQLARYVRAMSNSLGGSMETLYRLADGKVEALEFKVSADSACVNIPLKDLKLRPNILICALIRGSRSIRAA